MAVETFNLSPPPGFRGLDPDIPITKYERHLPQFRQEGATYFATFRLADSLPQEKLRQLKRMRESWERDNPPPRSERQWSDLARELTRCTEAWLDESCGECWLQVPEHAQFVATTLLHFQNQRHVTYCYCVMPNHCHVVVRPLGEYKLEDLLESWKSYVANQLNRRLGRRGALWQDESYDRIIRDEEHLYRIVQYIGNNPSKSRQPRDQWNRWVHPDWQAAGWDFQKWQAKSKH